MISHQLMSILSGVSVFKLLWNRVKSFNLFQFVIHSLAKEISL